MAGRIYRACPRCGTLWLEGFGDGFCNDCVERMRMQNGQMDLELEGCLGRDNHLQEVRTPAPAEL